MVVRAGGEEFKDGITLRDVVGALGGGRLRDTNDALILPSQADTALPHGDYTYIQGTDYVFPVPAIGTFSFSTHQVACLALALALALFSVSSCSLLLPT
jgi:hypothetical protein